MSYSASTIVLSERKHTELPIRVDPPVSHRVSTCNRRQQSQVVNQRAAKRRKGEVSHDISELIMCSLGPSVLNKRMRKIGFDQGRQVLLFFFQSPLNFSHSGWPKATQNTTLSFLVSASRRLSAGSSPMHPYPCLLYM